MWRERIIRDMGDKLMLRCSRTECMKNDGEGRCFPFYKEWLKLAEPKPDSKDCPFYEPWSEEERAFSRALEELDDAVWSVVRRIAKKHGVDEEELWGRYLREYA